MTHQPLGRQRDRHLAATGEQRAASWRPCRPVGASGGEVPVLLRVDAGHPGCARRLLNGRGAEHLDPHTRQQPLDRAAWCRSGRRRSAPSRRGCGRLRRWRGWSRRGIGPDRPRPGEAGGFRSDATPWWATDPATDCIAASVVRDACGRRPSPARRRGRGGLRIQRRVLGPGLHDEIGLERRDDPAGRTRQSRRCGRRGGGWRRPSSACRRSRSAIFSATVTSVSG